MVYPCGGTWTRVALFMKSSEGYKLIPDFDYDREPVLSPPYAAGDCAKKLEVFPRGPGATPDWMKIGIRRQRGGVAGAKGVRLHQNMPQ